MKIYMDLYIDCLLLILLKRKGKENFLKQLTRDNTQLIMNAIFNLPTKSGEDGVFATLPEPVTVIPREKPVSIF